ncbi:hypothetical protein AQUCO_01700313v1 [Aquilegia coerulea]|uniref:Uncharacterized protein n=1 Tax=Aquilegia coerulea TaxID=218851 RepID=A0A2G5DM89_AQUCA|nr:hypothetical protein AQUCO_01700313v1 [Aquilegia coerulea]
MNTTKRYSLSGRDQLTMVNHNHFYFANTTSLGPIMSLLNQKEPNFYGVSRITTFELLFLFIYLSFPITLPISPGLHLSRAAFC